MMQKRHDLYIRDAQDSERNTIRDVTLAAYIEYASITSAPFWEAYRQQLLATLNAEGPIERIIAEQNGMIVGSVLLYPPAANVYANVSTTATTRVSWPEVRLLAVLPAARGQGIGVMLMEECKRRARHAGATVLGLHTMDIMQTAMRMYERMGFVRAPEHDFRPGPSVLIKGYHLNLEES